MPGLLWSIRSRSARVFKLRESYGLLGTSSLVSPRSLVAAGESRQAIHGLGMQEWYPKEGEDHCNPKWVAARN